jgi:ubiquitin-protein ligase
MALRRLQIEYKQYLSDPNCYYTIEPDADNFHIWNILLFGSLNTIFENGVFKCQLIFPKEYPNKPPDFKFITKLPHPNIYSDGKVCISILHEGKDQFEYEDISERWNPSHSVNSILMSVLSMIIAPNFESPADLNMSKLWQSDFDEYKKIIYKIIANDN